MLPCPDFFIIGAQKSGSTWLADVLSQHDQVFVAPREIHYFDKLYNKRRGLDWYRSHFAAADSFDAIGEKTPEYLWANGNGGEDHNPRVHVDITTAFPDAKYLVVVRNPVDRAISALVHMVRTGRLPLLWPIDGLLGDRYTEWLRPWGIFEKGLYARQIKAYLDLIPRHRMKILVFEEQVLSNPKETMRTVCEYLGVSTGFEFKDLGKKRNRSPKTRRSLKVARLKRRGMPFAKLWSTTTPDQPISITAETRHKLTEYYRAENEALFEILGRSVPEWMSSGE